MHQEPVVRNVGPAERIGALAVAILAAVLFIGAASSDLVRHGTHIPADAELADFALWSSGREVARLVGDFDGDGRDDIALTGPREWSSVPVAFSNGDGSFRVTNAGVGAFAARSAERRVMRLVGDFDGDGRDDIALTGVPGWTSVSVAFSDGAGGFVVTDRWAGSFAAWASDTNAETVTGDFDGDGRADIAVRPNEDYVAVAYSKGNGSFDVDTRWVGRFGIGGGLGPIF